MAKKRKLTPKSSPLAAASAAADEATATTSASEEQPQHHEEAQEQIPEQQPEEEIQEQEEEEQTTQTTDADLEAADPETEDPETEDVEGEQEKKDENTPTQTEVTDAVTETNPNPKGAEEKEENGDEDDDDDEEEPVQNLLEPFTKDQLVEILREAADNHSDVLDNIRKLSDTDPVHRKIFVHGLGWDTNSESLTEVFKKYGDIEDCNCVTDKITGKSKGYAFILYKHRSGARKALKEPQKKIGSRMTACQLASAGPVPTQAHTYAPPAAVTAAAVPALNVSEYTQKKIYVSNVSADIDPQKLVNFFSKFGEIDEGPLGLDKQTGKPKGFALFVYKSVESARKALEEPHKTFEGHVLHCQKAIDGPKPNKPHFNQYQQHSHGGHGGGRPSKFARTDSSSYVGSHTSVGSGGHLMAQSVGPGMQYNQGASQAMNPVLGHALSALLASQGGGVGLTNLLAGVGPNVNPIGPPAMQGGYGNQYGGYGGQPGMQGGYGHSQMGQGSGGRSQKGGHMGGVNPYMGH